MGDIHIHMNDAPLPGSNQRSGGTVGNANPAPPTQKAAPTGKPKKASVVGKSASPSSGKPKSASVPKQPLGANPGLPVGASGSGLKKPTSGASSSSASSSSSSPKAPKNKSAGPTSSKGIQQGKTPASGKTTLGQQQQQTPANPTMGPLQGTKFGQSMPGAGMLPPSPTAQQKQAMKPPVPKKPPAEPKLPDDVAQARSTQNTVLKQRQARETTGNIKGAPREVNAGSGFWPPLSPLL